MREEEWKKGRETEKKEKGRGVGRTLTKKKKYHRTESNLPSDVSCHQTENPKLPVPLSRLKLGWRR